MELESFEFGCFPDPLTAKLSVIEFNDLPFKVKRIYWLTNFLPSTTRGNHAHKKLVQLFVLLQGEINIDFYYGENCKQISLRAGDSYLVPPGYWRVIRDASMDACILVLASEHYDPNDYIRDREEYLSWFSIFQSENARR